MRILTIHGQMSSGKTTFLCLAASALVKREVKKRDDSEDKVHVLVVGRTLRATQLLRRRFLEETENLGITGCDEERGCYVLHAVCADDLEHRIKTTYDFVMVDDVDWRTFFSWARSNQDRIKHLFSTEDVSRPSDLLVAELLSSFGDTHAVTKH